MEKKKNSAMWVLLSSLFAVCASEFTFHLEHSFGDSFSPRGSVELSYGKVGAVSFSQDKLSAEEVTSLIALSTQKGFYRLRLQLPSQSYLIASVPACALLSSDLKEVGHIFHLSPLHR